MPVQAIPVPSPPNPCPPNPCPPIPDLCSPIPEGVSGNSTTISVLGVTAPPGQSLVARLTFPDGLASQVVYSTSNNWIIPIGTSNIYIPLADNANVGDYDGSLTLYPGLPNGVYTIQTRTVSSNTDLTNITAVALAFEDSIIIRRTTGDYKICGPVGPVLPTPNLITATTRTQSIIQNYVLPLLGVFTRLQVWDELAQVLDSTNGILKTTYNNWTTDQEQIYRNDNDLLTYLNDYSLDRLNGQIKINNPANLIGSDFFTTYTFNYFAETDLTAFITLGMQLINASAEPDTHITTYTTVDATPAYWDAPMSLFAYMRALETLLMDSLIWKNYLIFQDGAAAQGLVEAEIQRTRSMFDEMKRSVKRVHYTTRPTRLYYLFATSGIGSFVNENNGRLRGFRSNRIGIPSNAGLLAGGSGG